MKTLKIIFISTILLSIISANVFPEILTLDKCIQRATDDNRTLMRSALSSKQAKLNTKLAYSVLYPSIGLSASEDSRKTNLPNEDWEMKRGLNGTVRQKIYSPGIYSDIRLSKINEKIADISQNDIQAQIRNEVETIYFNILTAVNLISVYKQNINVAEENLRKIRAMYKNGLKTESDILKSEVQKGSFESQLINEEQNLRSNKRELNILMGRNPEIDFSVEVIDVEKINIPDFETAQKIVIEKNRQLNILNKQRLSQNVSLRMAKESFLPTISGSYSLNQSENYVGGHDITSNSIGLSASFTLFDGFRRNQNIQKEKIEIKNLDFQIDEMQWNLKQNLLSLYEEINTYEKLLKIYKKNLDSALKDYELVSRQYELGASTILDQMNSQLSVIESQDKLIKIKYSRKIVESQIRYLLGS